MLSSIAIFKYFFVFFIIIFLFICAIYYYLSQKRISDRIGFSLKKKDWKSINNYIFTCGLTQNPANLKGNTTAAYEKHKLCNNLVNYFIKKAFHDMHQKRYYILADSGMGKTFFLYKLLIQYSMNPFSTYKIYYVNIESGNTDYLKRIEDIVVKTKNRKNIFELDKTILLVDGLENLWNSDIKKCYKSYQRLLMVTDDFYKIISTSTIRFFSKLDNDLSGLDESNNLLISMLSSQKIYLPYFTNDDLIMYLKKMFSSNSKLRKDITTYLKKRSYIVQSPLLLSYINDLKGKNFPYFYRIHKAIVDKALKVEQNENYKKLLCFCEDVAVFLYNNNKTSINNDTLFSLSKNNIYAALSVDELLDSAKNLLVTYSADSYTFIHISFYEYFLAVKAIKDVDFRLKRDFSNLESAEKFFNEMCKADIYKNKKAVFQKEHDYRGYDFSNINFEDCDFAGISLEYTTFAYAKLTGAILTGANFYNANLSHVIAIDTHFEDANLDGVILENAILDGATGIADNLITKNKAINKNIKAHTAVTENKSSINKNVTNEKASTPSNKNTIAEDVSSSDSKNTVTEDVSSSDSKVTATVETNSSSSKNTIPEKIIASAIRDASNNDTVSDIEKDIISSDTADIRDILSAVSENKNKEVENLSESDKAEDSKNSYNNISKIIVNRAHKVSKKIAIIPETVMNKDAIKSASAATEEIQKMTDTITISSKITEKDPKEDTQKSKNTFTVSSQDVNYSEHDMPLSAAEYKDYEEQGYENGETEDDASFEITVEKGGISTKLDMAAPEHNQGLKPDNIDNTSNADLENIDLVKLFATQNTKEAEEIMLPTLNKLIKLHPDNSTYYYFKGRTLGKLNKYEDALLELNSALIIEPDNVLYHYSKSVILYNLHRFEDALSEIELASISQPNNIKYHYFKTNILINLYQLKEALLEIDFCLSKDPTNAMYHHTKCVTLYTLHQFKTALEEIDLAIASDPDNAMYKATKNELLSNIK